MEAQPTKENKPSKLDKLVKISIIIGALIIALSVAYYLVVFLPSKEKMRQAQEILKQEEIKKDAELKELSDNENRCIELGRQAYQEETKNRIIGSLFEPQYKYNNKLKTCLYSGGVIYEGGLWNRFVKDLKTNQIIISVAFLPKDNSEESNKKIDDYWKMHNILFSD